MACGILYKDAIVITTVKKVDDSYVLDLPFNTFGQDIVRNGEMVTYSLDKLDGQEVMAKVDYKIDDDGLVRAFSGTLSNPKTAIKYSTHYPITYAESKATYDKDGNKVLYDGVDKSEKAEFCVCLSLNKAKIVVIQEEKI